VRALATRCGSFSRGLLPARTLLSPAPPPPFFTPPLFFPRMVPGSKMGSEKQVGGMMGRRPRRTWRPRATWTLWPVTSWTTSARRNSGELRLRELADRESAIHRNGGDLRLRGLAATGDGNSCAEEKSRAKRAKQKKIPNKNSWVHYFGKYQVKNAKHLEMDLFFLWQNV